MNKLTLPASENAIQLKINELVDDKQNKLVSGTNIKTINNLSLLGSGNIDIQGGGTITVDDELSTTSENPVQNKVITTELNKKIEGITSSDVTTALGYTPYNATNPNGYQANAIETVKVNGTAQTIINKTVDIPVPVVDSALSTTSTNPVQNKVITTELNKKIEGITSSDVMTALGYTPYNATNPNGYTSNKGTVTKVNNASPDSNGNVTISIPSAVTESTVSGWGFTKNTGTVTSVNNVPPIDGNVTLSMPSVEAYTASEVQTLWSSI